MGSFYSSIFNLNLMYIFTISFPVSLPLYVYKGSSCKFGIYGMALVKIRPSLEGVRVGRNLISKIHYSLLYPHTV